MDYPYSFQADSHVVNEAYKNLKNYRIIYNDNCQTNTCAIYFSGHSIYYPNNEEAFKYSIIEKDYYEWRNLMLKDVKKHIFLRDIFKQWYLSGINSNLSTQEKLLDFLKKETSGLDIITIGSSAGGYAAILYGSMLKAKYIYAFSPRLEMLSREKLSNPIIDPLFFRLKNTSRRKYMDLLNLLDFNYGEFFLFYPLKSQLDIIQLNHVKNNLSKCNEHLHFILFKTSKHGVPFPKIALFDVFNSSVETIISLSKKGPINPVLFSIKLSGLRKTILGIYHQSIKFIFHKLRL